MGCSAAKSQRELEIIEQNKLDKAKLSMERENYEIALEIYLEMHDKHPQNSIFPNKIGYCYSKLGNNEKAINYYNLALQSQPKNAYYYNKGNSLSQMNQTKEALACYYKALDLVESDWNINNNISHCLYQLGKYHEALPYIDKALVLNKSSSLLNFNKAKILNALNNKIEALEYYNLAIEMSNTNCEYLAEKGIFLYELEKWWEAMDIFTKAISIQNEALYYYFRALCKDNLKLDSNDDYEMAKKLSYSNENRENYTDKDMVPFSQINFDYNFRKSALLFEAKKYDKVIEANNEILRMDPNYIDAYIMIGLCNEELGRYKEAISQYNMVLKTDYSQHEVFFHKGKCLYLIEQYGEAIDNLNHSIIYDDKNIEAYFYKSLSQASVAKPAESIKTIQKGTSMCSDNTPKHYLHYYEGLVFLKNEMFKRSIIAFDQSITLFKGFHLAMYQKAQVLIKTQQYYQALDTIDMALSYEESNSLYQISKGLILFKLGRIEEMTSMLTKLGILGASNNIFTSLDSLPVKDRSQINQTLEYISKGYGFSETTTTSKSSMQSNITLINEQTSGKYGKVINNMHKGKVCSFENITYNNPKSINLSLKIGNIIKGAIKTFESKSAKLLKYFDCVNQNNKNDCLQLISEPFDFTLKNYIIECEKRLTYNKKIELLVKILELMNWCCMNQITASIISDNNIVVCNINNDVKLKLAYYQFEQLIDDYTNKSSCSFPFISLMKLKNGSGYSETISEGYSYSFGMFMWEIFTMKIPFKADKYKTRDHFLDYASNVNIKSQLKGLHDKIPKDLIVLIERCLNVNPKQRPTLSEITQELSNCV